MLPEELIPKSKDIMRQLEARSVQTIGIDTTTGENGEEPIRHITPETAYAEIKG